MLKDKALVRSKVIRAVTAGQATDDLASILPLSAGELTVIRAYRFYKKLSAEPVRKTYIAIDKLLSAKEAIAVMTAIENRHVPIVIRPEDLPQDHPDHVCTDKCYDIVPLNEANEAKFFPKFGDPQPATVFVPEWGPNTSVTIKEVPTSGERLPADAFDTSNVAAGQPSPYFFPDRPLVPTKDAVFDDSKCGDEVVTSRGFTVCRWHGWKYIDLRDGRCTALDPGSRCATWVVELLGGDLDAERLRAVSATIAAATAATNKFNDSLVTTNAAAKEFSDAVPRNVDLDEAAPIVHPAPDYAQSVQLVRELLADLDANRDYSYREPVTAVEAPDTPSTPEEGQGVDYVSPDEANGSSKAPLITLATIAAIVGLVLAYFHWFKH